MASTWRMLCLDGAGIVGSRASVDGVDPRCARSSNIIHMMAKLSDSRYTHSENLFLASISTSQWRDAA